MKIRLKEVLLALLLSTALFGQETVVELERKIDPQLMTYYGFFMGIMIFIALTSMLQYYFSKDWAYAYYGIYVFLNFLYFLNFYESLLPPENALFFGKIFTKGTPGLISLLIGSYLVYYLFTIKFLNLSKIRPQITKIFRGFVYYFAFLIVLILASEIFISNPYHIRLVADISLATIIPIASYSVYKMYSIRSFLSNILVTGTLFYLIGSALGFLFGLFFPDIESSMPFNDLLFSTKVGLLIELIFFAVGLSIRGEIIKKEKEEALRLQEINEIRNRFFTNITHEFRTPLTVIKGLTEELKSNPNLQWQSRLNTVSENSDQLLNLVNQMLDLSRLETGSMDTNMQQGDLVNYLNYLVEGWQTYARTKKINLSFFADESQIITDFDAEKLNRILQNLISNALKYTPEFGEIKITIKTQKKGHKILIINILDNGSGIPEVSLPHIFDRFYQANNSQTKQGQGTGIGLALVKELVELLGGNISVKSEINKGTNFEIKLPKTNKAKIKEEGFSKNSTFGSSMKFEKEKAIQESYFHDSKKPVLLIIEDNADVVKYLCACLHNNYNYLIARNGKTGIEIAIEKIPDIILSDVMMPKADGFEVTETLKNDERTSHIPIVLLTAKATREDRIEGLSRGADAYLQKPFDKKELLIRLQNLVGLRKQLQAEIKKGQSIQSAENIFIEKLTTIIHKNMADENFNVPRLCRKIGMSRTQLHRKIKALTDMSTTEFVNQLKLEKAHQLLQTTDKSITEIAWATGYKQASNFSTAYKNHFGVSPSETHK